MVRRPHSMMMLSVAAQAQRMQEMADNGSAMVATDSCPVPEAGAVAAVSISARVSKPGMAAASAKSAVTHRYAPLISTCQL